MRSNATREPSRRPPTTGRPRVERACIAFAALGDGDRAWQLFDLMNPISHGASAADIAVYKVRPYVVAGNVYAFAPHAGRGGWTWYTGAAGWMVQLLVESLLGLDVRGARLRLRPLLPRPWPGFELRYRYRATVYTVECRRAASADAVGVRVNGALAADGWVDLHDDGKPRSVTVDVWTGHHAPLAA